MLEINGKKAYRTRFENKSDKPIRLFESNGIPFCVLQAGCLWEATSINPRSYYARWSHLAFEKDGEITLRKNKDWEAPWSKDAWVTEFFNNSPTLQGISLYSQSLAVYRGIPLLTPVPLDCPWIWYSRVEWLSKEVEKSRPPYIVKEIQLVCIKTPRGKRDIEKIQQELDENRRKKAESEMGRKMSELPEAVQKVLKEEPGEGEKKE